ncbi:NAD-dependent epimerase [Cycloclasticus pugetii]|uniref:NAD-dependent epimerase n=1 Tax=Cycloclasticus pugetii TaxID=34068 RepID=UPI00091D262E|nr:NAD-dependent epimerase [Cycloclasticus pugetii]SHJ39526.1 UDP-glucuronate 4-epimerase [Cycloclasticus pugetii]
MKYLITGAAGFIGHYVVERLSNDGHDVIGLDNLNDYYDPNLKLERLKRLDYLNNFIFRKMDLCDRDNIAKLFEKEKFQRVIHLGAQAGVRYSIENPMAYIDSNIVGFANILEGCRHNNVEHLVYASSSSVYGANRKVPFSESDNVDSPLSLYAATKKSNELMAFTYSHLYNLRVTGLRFFTVYGPWGRPDMAPFLFANAIANGKAINVYNNGQMQRDFTYIDDVVEGIFRIKDIVPSNENLSDKTTSSLAQIYNIGNNQPATLEKFIKCIEESLNRKAVKNYMPMQDGDMVRTYANISRLENEIGYKPTVGLMEGVSLFIDWYKKHYM